MAEPYRNPDNDPRGPWLAGTLISPHYRASGDFEVVTPGGAAHRAPIGTSWRVPGTLSSAYSETTGFGLAETGWERHSRNSS